MYSKTQHIHNLRTVFCQLFSYSLELHQRCAIRKKKKKETKKLNPKPCSLVITVIIKAILNNLELALLLNPTHQRGRQRGGEQCSSVAAR